MALLATLVLLFGFQGEQIVAQPLLIALIAVPTGAPTWALRMSALGKPKKSPAVKMAGCGHFHRRAQSVPGEIAPDISAERRSPHNGHAINFWRPVHFVLESSIRRAPHRGPPKYIKLRHFGQIFMQSKTTKSGACSPPNGSKRGRKPLPVPLHPNPLSHKWIEPDSFHEALSLHMKRHQESYIALERALARVGIKINSATIKVWASGLKLPRNIKSMLALTRIEERYGLPDGYFRAKIPSSDRASTRHPLRNVARSEQRRLAWHLPENFSSRSKTEQAEILAWIRTVVISGATEYRRYQSEAAKRIYAIRFPSLTGRKSRKSVAMLPAAADNSDADLVGITVDAPPQLVAEMAELVRFKSSTLTDIGFQRSGVWGEETAAQKIEHMGLMFGALASSPDSSVAGRGIPMADSGFAMLILPRVWDWYIQWRERRRGFYTRWEVEMLRLAMTLTREKRAG